MMDKDLQTASLENETLKIEYLTSGALRLAGLYVNNSDNLLALKPDIQLPLGESGYPLVGGHRLWASPEKPGWSYGLEENIPLEIESRHNHLRLIQSQAESANRLRKELLLRLDEHAPLLTIEHRLINDGDGPVTAAPWAISVLPVGGVVLLPFPRKESDSSLLPERNLVFWPYTNPEQLHMTYLTNAVLLPTVGRKAPSKLGTYLKAGWCAYYKDGILFKKQIHNQKAVQNYPDFGSSCEVYMAEGFLELETLGPLAAIPPGESASHTETWEFLTDLSMDDDIAPYLENLEAFTP
jgi:hypothetical protein